MFQLEKVKLCHWTKSRNVMKIHFLNMKRIIFILNFHLFKFEIHDTIMIFFIKCYYLLTNFHILKSG